jgi:hypothetical protein
MDNQEKDQASVSIKSQPTEHNSADEEPAGGVTARHSLVTAASIVLGTRRRPPKNQRTFIVPVSVAEPVYFCAALNEKALKLNTGTGIYSIFSFRYMYALNFFYFELSCLFSL